MVKRVTVAISTPFRMILVRFQKMFNVNILSAKLIKPLTSNVRKLITLKPSSKEDYFSLGRFWVYKKLFACLVLALCAGVFIYFSMFAAAVEAPPQTMTAIKTDITFRYDDIKIKDFSGLANIKAQDGNVVYTGEIASGICKGMGTLFSREGYKLYEGQFDRNRYNGIGTAYYPDGTVKYEGNFVDNLYEGPGLLMDRAGNLLYDGEFKGGSFEGSGKLYNTAGNLIYEGDFSDGKRHGNGTWYSDLSVPCYKGSFFQDAYHGEGTLYTRYGKPIYTGLMLNGEINYQSLVGATLADVEAAFTETPRIYYQEGGGSCFVFEQAGVVISADCRVKVGEWERPGDNASDGYYFMPNEGAYGSDFDVYGEDYNDPEDSESDDPPTYVGMVGAHDTPQITFAAASTGLSGWQPVNWQVFDPYTSESDESSSSSALDKEELWSDFSSRIEKETAKEESAPSVPEQQQPSSEADTTTQNRTDEPEFIDKQLTLYFEIDKNVWRSESALNENGGTEKSKIFVKRVTVLNSELPPIHDVTATEMEDNAPLSIEDCVAIDYIRLQEPTAFSSIAFQMDKANKLFVRLWNINYADYMSRRIFEKDGLIFTYCFNDGEEETPSYYSIEK